MALSRGDRVLLATGVALMGVAFVGMSVRPFAFADGDMRVFDWIGANAVLTVVGIVLVLVVPLRRLIRP